MARRVLGALLLAMSVGQLSDVGGFVDIVATYEMGGRGVAWLVALVLLAGESFAAIGLLAGAGRTRRRASIVALVVTLAWTALATQAFVRGLVLPNCGCFGVHLGQELRWWVLVEDAQFVALALWVRRGARAETTDARPVARTGVAG